jgi:CHAT domain-containing protein/Tfp pilus assembly protein PilF
MHIRVRSVTAFLVLGLSSLTAPSRAAAQAGARAEAALSLLNQCARQYSEGALQQASTTCQRAYRVALRADDQQHMATALNNLGIIDEDLHLDSRAEAEYQRALVLERLRQDDAWAARTQVSLAELYEKRGKPQLAIAAFREATALRQKLGTLALEATARNNLGHVLASIGEKQEALEQARQALAIYESLGDEDGQAAAHNNIGTELVDTGDAEAGLVEYHLALELELKAGDALKQATTLNNLGQAEEALSRPVEAREDYQHALRIDRAQADLAGQAIARNNIGSLELSQGRVEEARMAFESAGKLSRSAGDKRGVATALGNLASVYDSLGERHKALATYTQALTIAQATGDRPEEATLMDNVGSLYGDLGAPADALPWHQRALALRVGMGDLGKEAVSLSNLGASLQDLGRTAEAEANYEHSLALRRQVHDRPGEAHVLIALGTVQSAGGRKEDALTSYQAAEKLSRLLDDRADDASALNNIGVIEDELGRKEEALRAYDEALRAKRLLRDREGEAVVLGNVADLWQTRGDADSAIFYRKQQVNLYQGLRRDTHGLDKVLEKSYLNTVAGVYRTLADLLLQQQRLAEAEQVLDMLKEQEYKQFAGAGQPQPMQQIAYTKAEQAAAESGPAAQTLTAALPSGGHAATPSGEERGGEGETPAQQLLRRHHPGSVLIYTVVLEDRLDLLLVTPAQLRSVSVAVNRAKVADTVRRLRAAILSRQPGEALLGPAGELYRWLYAPLGLQAEEASFTTIAWSLDDVLRYVPMNVLYDGHGYLIERYANVIFAPGQFNDDAATGRQDSKFRDWQALAVGVSKGYGADLKPLPAVTGELRSVVHDRRDATSHGPFAGRILLDDAFSESALNTQLRLGYPIVHIASHFVLGPSSDESYLLLGGKAGATSGRLLRLSDIDRMQGLALAGVSLMTLSACETAMSQQEGGGREIDSLAAIARQHGARAVLATLWSVNDASTGRLMAAFYQQWSKQQSREGKDEAGPGKAGALRQAQLGFLHSVADMQQASRSDRSFTKYVDASVRKPSNAFNAPYYWSAFILIGDWD